MAKVNSEKRVPNGEIKFSLSLNDEQKTAKHEILTHPINFVLGQAGSGKTLLACQIALDLFFKRQIDRIIITRPTVGTENNGFLPGTFKEKMDPWLVPIKDNMRKIYNKPEILTKLEAEDKIELVSLEHFRGRTFDNAVCIIDEFQNLSKQQLKMALGRLGKDSIMIFTGDNEQIDLKFPNDSAIHEISKLKSSKYVYSVKLKENHRHPALTEIFGLLSDF